MMQKIRGDIAMANAKDAKNSAEKREALRQSLAPDKDLIHLGGKDFVSINYSD